MQIKGFPFGTKKSMASAMLIKSEMNYFDSKKSIY